MSSAVVSSVKISRDVGNGDSYALAILRAVGLNFCTSGWLRRVNKAVKRNLKQARVDWGAKTYQ